MVHKGYGGTGTVPSYGNGLTHTHASACFLIDLSPFPCNKKFMDPATPGQFFLYIRMKGLSCEEGGCI